MAGEVISACRGVVRYLVARRKRNGATDIESTCVVNWFPMPSDMIYHVHA